MAVRIFEGELPEGYNYSIRSFKLRERMADDLAPARAMAAKMDPVAAKMGGDSMVAATNIEVLRRCIVEVDGQPVNGADYMDLNKWTAATLEAVVTAFFEHLVDVPESGKATGRMKMI